MSNTCVKNIGDETKKKPSNTSDLTRLAKAGVMKPFLEEKLAFHKVNLVTLSENQESQAKKKS